MGELTSDIDKNTYRLSMCNWQAYASTFQSYFDRSQCQYLGNYPSPNAILTLNYSLCWVGEGLVHSWPATKIDPISLTLRNFLSSFSTVLWPFAEATCKRRWRNFVVGSEKWIKVDRNGQAVNESTKVRKNWKRVDESERGRRARTLKTWRDWRGLTIVNENWWPEGTEENEIFDWDGWVMTRMNVNSSWRESTRINQGERELTRLSDSWRVWTKIDKSVRNDDSESELSE